MAESVLRPSEARDRPALLTLIIELQEHERRLHDGLLPGAQIAEAYLAYLERHLTASGGELWVAELEGGVVGFVAFLIDHYEGPEETADSATFVLVSDICVAQAQRGRGIAQMLLDRAEAFARERGMARLRIEVLSANNEARRAYRRFGFEPYVEMLEKVIC